MPLWTRASISFGASSIFQYTGTGRIPGYGGHLDLDLFYGTHDDWRRLCAVAGASRASCRTKAASPRISPIPAAGRAEKPREPT